MIKQEKIKWKLQLVLNIFENLDNNIKRNIRFIMETRKNKLM